MHPNSVFAAATSRLHADLIVIRLRRAGISRERISAIFPVRLRPNSAECWLDGSTLPARFLGEEVVVAGPLHQCLELGSEAAFVAGLQHIGLGRHDAHACAERLGKGQILIAIQTADETEVAIAWHTLRELEAEGIALAIATETAPTEARNGTTRRRRWGARRRSRTPDLLPAHGLGAV